MDPPPPPNTGAGSQVAHKESPWGVLLILFLLLLPTGPSPVTAETMALGVLCLATLTLLGVLQSQAQDSTENLIPAPSLLKVPLQPGFQKDRVGTWKGSCRREWGKRGADGRSQASRVGGTG